ncbi:MAG: hypothetical protein JOY61_08535 [Chloroflexi bacterium]|nr:hypothetical protein [Chloroflexota bacterium]
MACRRENPVVVRAATATAVAAANQQAVQAAATATAVVQASTSGGPTTTARRARVAAGNLGVAATGISAGIQLWSRPGGVMAGGATMTGTVSDGVEVDVIDQADFLGQRYFRIRGPSQEGWIDGRFLQLE